MPGEILSNFSDFSKKLPRAIDRSKEAERLNALKHYFEKGGVISIVEKKGSWPLLHYPSKLRLKRQIDEIQQLRNHYSTRFRSWQRKYNEARIYYVTQNMLKVKEPLYWKHMLKYATDSDYRNDTNSVKLPVNLVADKRWKPMVKMFVNDIEYRKQLAETVQHSIVYGKDKKVAKYANVLRDFRMQESERKMKELQKRLDTIDADINAMNEMLRWAAT